MSIALRVLICMAGVILIALSRNASINKKMTEKQGLFWIVCGLIVFLFGLIPKFVFLVADLFYVDYAPSIMFTIAIMFLFYGIFDCYSTNAELIAKVQELAMQTSLLNDENVKLKKKIKNFENEKDKELFANKNKQAYDMEN